MNDADCIDVVSRVVAMARSAQTEKNCHVVTQNLLKAANERVAKLERALGNIKMHAAARVGGNSELGQIFFPALRDYVAEAARPSHAVWQNTDGTSAASRWGFDFTKEPETTIRPVRRVTY